MSTLTITLTKEQAKDILDCLENEKKLMQYAVANCKATDVWDMCTAMQNSKRAWAKNVIQRQLNKIQ